jgi:hypothetical protein
MVVNVRVEGGKISIWTTEYENREAVTHIWRVYKERLGLPPKIVIINLMQTQLLRAAPPLKIGLLFKKTPSEYSHRRLRQVVEIWELNQSLIKAEWTAFKFDSI